MTSIDILAEVQLALDWSNNFLTKHFKQKRRNGFLKFLFHELNQLMESQREVKSKSRYGLFLVRRITVTFQARKSP